MSTENLTMSYDRTVDIVRNAIPRMSDMKIPITPSNYAVWYEYLSESNEPLQKEMDKLLSRGADISDDEMRVLYEQYLEERSEKVQVAKTALSKVVSALMSHISHADGHYTSFSSELEDIAKGIDADTNADGLNALIDRAVQATNTALEHGAELKQKFSHLATEMQEVRGKLARSQEEARADPLTGLLNRLAFQEQLQGLTRKAGDETHPTCLLVVDIDFFKRVNDTFGHLAGDHVLRRVAQEIKASVRGRDMVARYGGEEFVVLLEDTPRSGCLAVAENIRASIERCIIHLPVDVSEGKILSVTASLGGGWYRDGESPESLVDRADRALYLSKENGRNRVTWENRQTEN